MTLIARESIFSKAMAEDPYFNEEAALKSYNLIMKMDEDEARVFTQDVVANVVWDTIVKNHRTVQGHLDTVVAKRLERVKNSLQATVINKRMNDEPLDEEIALATAGALALIEKAVQKNPYDYGYKFNENDFRRGPGGRFTTKISQNVQQRPSSNRHAASLGIPTGGRKDGNATEKRISRLSGKKKAEFQSQYMQVASALGNFDNDDDATLLIRRKGADANAPVETVRTKANKRGIEQNWNPMTEDVVGVKVDPKSLSVGGASFNLAGALGASPDRARYAADTVDAVDQNFGQFSNDWMASDNKDHMASNARTYERLRSGSEFLGQVAPRGSKAQMAGAFGAFVGSHGPEAEKIVGPHARKTAYRYRGVTKAPDGDIKREYSRLLMSDQKLNGKQAELVRSEQGKAIKRATLIETKRRNPKASNDEIKQLANGVRLPEAKRAQMMELGQRKAMTGINQRVSDDTRTIARNKVADLLQHRKNTPKGSLYQLQLSSGHLPPSEGVIIDKNGAVKVQAVGYADDHYLPFNLKQLGALKGGEYIRTRSVGGPTSEDIYTGLMTGAKAVTVVSRSGTFTVDFEDDFKGTRRYNDKAKRMIGRYQKLLDAVQSGTVNRGEQIPREIRNRIYADVANSEEFQWNDSDDELKAAQRNAVKVYAQTPEITDADEDWIEIKTRAFTNQYPEADSNQAEQGFRNQLKADKEVNFQLNARGYEAALDSLREQFPYYIKDTRTSHRKDDADMGTSTRDLGYVKPRHNRPAAAKAGWHDKSITGHDKFSADEADYQNYGVRRQLKTGAVKPTESTVPDTNTVGSAVAPSAEEPAKTKAPQTAKQTAQKINSNQRLADVTDQIYSKLWSSADGDTRKVTFADVGDPQDLINEIKVRGYESPRLKALREQIDDGDNAEKVFGNGSPNSGMLGDDGVALRVKFHDALGQLGSEAFTPEKAMELSSHPMSFEGSAYSQNDAEPGAVLKEMKRVSQDSVAGNTKRTDDMTDAELQSEIIVMKRAQSAVKNANEFAANVDESKRAAVFNDFIKSSSSVSDKPAIKLAVNHPEQLEKMAEGVQRMRTLRRVADHNQYEKTEQSKPAEVGQDNAQEATATQDTTVEWKAKKAFESLDGMIARAEKQGNQEAVDEFSNVAQQLQDEMKLNTPENDMEFNTMLSEIGMMSAKMHKLNSEVGKEEIRRVREKVPVTKPTNVTGINAKKKKTS